MLQHLIKRETGFHFLSNNKCCDPKVLFIDSLLHQTHTVGNPSPCTKLTPHSSSPELWSKHVFAAVLNNEHTWYARRSRPGWQRCQQEQGPLPGCSLRNWESQGALWGKGCMHEVLQGDIGISWPLDLAKQLNLSWNCCWGRGHLALEVTLH